MDDLGARIALALGKREDVVFAYLFGSQATGRTHARSDVDVAVWLRPGDRLRDPLLDLIGAVKDACGRDDVDVVILNEAPLWIAARVLRGRLILDRDEVARVKAEAHIMLLYHDRLPYYRRHLEHAGRSLAERGFG